MSLKRDRIWAQRSEAILLLAAQVVITDDAVGIVAALFNSAPSTIRADVARHRDALVTRLRAKRAAEDALLAAHASVAAEASGTEPTAQEIATEA